MSEKGQGQNGGGAKPEPGGGLPPRPPDEGPPGGGDPGPEGKKGGGGGAKAPEKKPIQRGPRPGGMQFEDGSRLEQDENGKWRYTDPGGRTGLWEGGESWVEEGTGQPMPSDFKPKTPGEEVGWVGRPPVERPPVR